MSVHEPYWREGLWHYWEHRKLLSLRRAKDRGAASKLLYDIYAWSKRQRRWGPNAGGWVNDMEYLCWRREPKLRLLARRAGGWWCWRDGVVFVPYQEWIEQLETWEQWREAQRISIKCNQRLATMTKRATTGKSRSGFYRWETTEAAAKLRAVDRAGNLIIERIIALEDRVHKLVVARRA